MNAKNRIVQVAISAPLRQVFDYLVVGEKNILPGCRVKVPFQRREMVGIAMGTIASSNIPLDKLKPITDVLDTESLFANDVWQLCLWAADYYHHPIGEVLLTALPILLRQGKLKQSSHETYWQLTVAGRTVDFATLARAPRQIELLKLFAQHPEGITTKQLKTYDIPTTLLKTLQKKNFIVAEKKLILHAAATEKSLPLNNAQQAAVAAIEKTFNTFQVTLLDGITGSGKTEVYLQSIEKIIAQQQQVLVLIPEIGLTPQTILRFRQRFSVPVVALHSGLSEKERLNAWLASQAGVAKIIIGTRSAVFSPFANLGLIIVDEEHDLSFKQQDGFRYHARDVAIKRAQLMNIPIVLGSATPSLETLHNAQLNRYQQLILPERAGKARLPLFYVQDIRNLPLENGLSTPLVEEIKNHLHAGNQVMLFLNRRGFAPVLMCHGCGWIAMCKRCDARMTYHQRSSRLHCHHCDTQRPLPQQCVTCHSVELMAVGQGTERLEQTLQQFFPAISIARIDRDTTQRKGQMENLLDGIQRGEHKILIGTQMLAKGHHFPDVTLVAIVDADGGFFSGDFRALERMGQLVLQVAGRAGRVEKPGKVILQTRHPDHPLLHQLLHQNYRTFANSLLIERESTTLPPFIFFALLRAEAHHADYALHFLQHVKTLITDVPHGIHLLGPLPSPMPRRAGLCRGQLLLQAKNRGTLQRFVKLLLPKIAEIPDKKRVRWSIDIDPVEVF